MKSASETRDGAPRSSGTALVFQRYLVDAGIVVTENAFRFVEKRGVNPRSRRRVAEAVLEAARLVGRPVFFSNRLFPSRLVPRTRTCAPAPRGS